MVLFTLSKHLTRFIAPRLFRSGMALRNWLAPPLPFAYGDRDLESSTSSPSSPSSRTRGGHGSIFGNTINNYLLDMMFLIPYSQKLLSLDIYDASRLQAAAYYKKIEKEQKAKEPSSYLPPSHRASLVSPGEVSNIRVNVLEEILRPCLLPTLRWSPDVEEGWRYNIRVVAWVRKEFLIAKYGPHIQDALAAYPILRSSPQLRSSTATASFRRMILNLIHHGRLDIAIWNEDKETSHHDKAMILPPSSVVIKAFGMRGWATAKNSQAVCQAMFPIVKKLGGHVVQKKSLFGTQLEDTEASVMMMSKKTPASTGSQETGLGYGYHAVIPYTADLNDVSLEEILEIVTCGHVATCGPLNALCQEANFYQFWTKEYIEHLGDYLLERAATLRSETHYEDYDKDNGNLLVLDVGAGDGLLTRLLKENMENIVKKDTSTTSRRLGTNSSISGTSPIMPTLVATDDMSWGIFAKAEVEKLSVQQALQKYVQFPKSDYDGGDENDGNSDRFSRNSPRGRTVVILCSWMPMGQDWSALFRDSGVEEYILIGEADDGSCGHNWKTWGNPTFFDPDESGNENTILTKGGRAPVPPYEVDGYQRWDMNVLSQFQFSSFDCSISKSGKTVSFRKHKRKISQKGDM